ncbi:MAG: HAMP domain-containing sensor histidine kinase [Verrucomicrobiales bacterium]|nr:HAMP domain-containing sensor histidine kinase [Verrucomicrobiales bacterium]
MKRLKLNLNLTGVIVTLAVGVLLPVLLSTAVGIVVVVLAEDTAGIVTGVLVISFAVATIGSALVAIVLTGNRARLARSQADFVANVSHEFRTPLSAIRLYAQTLQSGKLKDNPEQMANCIDTILRETEWLDVMVERVLMWRTSSKDLMPLNLERCPVNHVVETAVDRFRGMIPPDEVVLTCDIESQIDVEHDEHALQAVVLNLLTNAYKYTGKNKEIQVVVKDVEDEVVIAVTDNGIGISPGDRKRIFQPFFRAEDEHREGASGAGLGLAIAHNLVVQHEGSITVESEPDKGATFSIHLPAAKTGV